MHSVDIGLGNPMNLRHAELKMYRLHDWRFH